MTMSNQENGSSRFEKNTPRISKTVGDPPICLWGTNARMNQPILVVDSNKSNRNLLVTALLPLGHPVLTASNEAYVLATCALRRPCLLVLGRTDDEKINSIELLHKVKRLAPDKTPLIGVRLKFTAQHKSSDDVRIIGPFILEDLLGPPRKRLRAPQEKALRSFVRTSASDDATAPGLSAAI
jgi:CheY-like chemotaxis protein